MFRKIPTFIYILTAIVSLLLIVYFVVPIIILKNVNSVMSKTTGYKGHVNGFHWDIPNIGYYLTGFEIKKIEGNISHTFIHAEKISNILDFAALANGKLYGITNVYDLKVNLVKGATKTKSQFGDEGNWIKTLQDLPNYTINNASISNGTIVYYDHLANPDKAITITDISVRVYDLQKKATKEIARPTQVYLKGSTVDTSEIEVNGNFNAFKTTPDVFLNYKLTNLDLITLNSLTKAYADVDFENGNLALKGEVKLSNNHLKGFAEIQIENIKMLSWKKDKDESFFQKLKVGFIQTFIRVTTHPKSQTFEVKIPFEGSLEEVKIKFMPALVSIFKKEFNIIKPSTSKSKSKKKSNHGS